MTPRFGASSWEDEVAFGREGETWGRRRAVVRPSLHYTCITHLALITQPLAQDCIFLVGCCISSLLPVKSSVGQAWGSSVTSPPFPEQARFGDVRQRRETEEQHGALTHFLSTTGEEAAGSDRLIHERDLAWLQQADVVVAEVTQPSLGVGYELGRAVALSKRILCLFRPQSGRELSAMIRGAADGWRFQVWDYEEAELEALLDRYFEADSPEQVP
nr:2'-deoxynucleoside 5'-phosphate N-hydrolase 1 [Vicugna pacos]